MIRPLRQRHRRSFAALGVLLPIVFVLGIVARRPVPSVGSLPAELAATPDKFTATIWERRDLFAKVPVQVRLVRESASAGDFAVSFAASEDFAKPDLIAYWVAGNPGLAGSVPEDAQLLGAFGSAALRLPARAVAGEGVLILFSLADQEVVDVSKSFGALATGTERGSVTGNTSEVRNSLERSNPSPPSDALRLTEPRSNK